MVTPALPIHTLRELTGYTKASSRDVFMASADPGSQSHLAGIMLLEVGNFKSIHVPYRGGGASVLAVISGEALPADTCASPASSLVFNQRIGW